MTDLFIVVEGREDSNFINQLIEHRIKNPKTYEFIYTNTNAQSLSRDLITSINIETVSMERPAVFIMDADDSKSKGASHLLNAFPNISEDTIFLLPNHSDNGNLETLLRGIIPENYEAFLSDCIDTFASCVKSLQLKEYSVGEKDKFFIYHSGLTRKDSSGSKRIYKHPYYDMDSPMLDPLVVFLKKHLK